MLLCLPLWTQSTLASEVWVSPEGSDLNPGTRESPVATIPEAQRLARELRRLGKIETNEPVKIVLRGGVYRLREPLRFGPEDSGTANSPTIIEPAAEEHPVLSGGVTITGWRRASRNIPGLPAASRGNVWTAGPPRLGGRFLEFRQLWVNDRKAIRAREPNGGTLERLVGWDRKQERAWIPARLIHSLRSPSGVELILQQQWEIAILRLKSFRTEGEEACVTFQQPESGLEFAHPWPQPILSPKGNAAFFLANAIEFLDQPGEWYQSAQGRRLYYWPRPGEDMTKASVIAPAVETLARVVGSLDHPASYVHFKGIEFAHTTWLRPSTSGHVPLQAGMFLLRAYRLTPKGTAYHPGLDNLAWIGRPPAAVVVDDAHHIKFERCHFVHLASAGLDFVHGTHDDVIEGNLFHDIGGNGIQMAHIPTGGIETHIPYNPSDERVICTRERIANSLITDCGKEDWGCVGICVGYGREIAMEHNEISNLPYTGISLGWGWTKLTNCMRGNRVFANRVHDVAKRLCDTAGIYTLSAQPGTVISRNSIYDIRMSSYVFDPNHWFYLYLDEGSSFITVRDNWCPEERFMKNANGPGNVWQDNGSTVSQNIRNNAGLEPAFQDLLRESPDASSKFQIRSPKSE